MGKCEFGNWVAPIKSSVFTPSLCLEVCTEIKIGKHRGKGTVFQICMSLICSKKKCVQQMVTIQLKDQSLPMMVHCQDFTYIVGSRRNYGSLNMETPISYIHIYILLLLFDWRSLKWLRIMFSATTWLMTRFPWIMCASLPLSSRWKCEYLIQTCEWLQPIH